jgi:hypothetical protein
MAQSMYSTFQFIDLFLNELVHESDKTLCRLVLLRKFGDVFKVAVARDRVKQLFVGEVDVKSITESEFNEMKDIIHPRFNKQIFTIAHDKTLNNAITKQNYIVKLCNAKSDCARYFTSSLQIEHIIKNMSPALLHANESLANDRYGEWLSSKHHCFIAPHDAIYNQLDVKLSLEKFVTHLAMLKTSKLCFNRKWLRSEIFVECDMVDRQNIVNNIIKKYNENHDVAELAKWMKPTISYYGATHVYYNNFIKNHSPISLKEYAIWFNTILPQCIIL